jgi:hypothetical protein
MPSSNTPHLNTRIAVLTQRTEATLRRTNHLMQCAHLELRLARDSLACARLYLLRVSVVQTEREGNHNWLSPP